MLGIQYPIVQGPFGGRFSSAKLVSVVSNMGGLGSFGLHAYSPEEILAIGAEIRALTPKPFALNLWVPLENDPANSYSSRDFEKTQKSFSPYFEALKLPLPEMPQARLPDFEQQLEAILNIRPAVASFIFGVPSPESIQELKKANIKLIATATTLEEAMLIEEAGIDLVVASGSEAGGHRASFLKSAEDSLTKTADLVPQLVSRLKIPVIAAGGISDGKAAFSALKRGAAAVQVGTAFLATEESNASPPHKKRLFAPTVETTLTKAYTGRLARAIANIFTAEVDNLAGAAIAPYPIQSEFLSPLMKAYKDQHQWEYVAFWSGQPSAVLRHQSAAGLFKAFTEALDRLYQAS